MIYSLMSHSWSGLLIAALIAVSGLPIVHVARRLQPRWRPLGLMRFLGYGFYGLAGLALIGSGVAMFRIGNLEAKYAAPGKLVDVGGYRMHILAEGEKRGKPTVVWISGAHGQGLLMHHLHKLMRAEGRSILFDRPGTGWSDTGPYPRTTAREAEELAVLLEKSGEKGPFLVVGHSYGGLLAVNFARRFPDRVASLVLLDATPPDSAYGSFTGVDAMAAQVTMQRVLALSKLMGFQYDFAEAAAKQDKQVAAIVNTIYGQLRDVLPQIKANEAGPAANLVAASIFEEFSPENLRRSAMNLVVYDGELGAMPVSVVVPQGDFDAAVSKLEADPATQRRILTFLTNSRLRYLKTSSNAALFYAPPGTTHNFPYERPMFVMDVVRQAIAAN